MRRIESERRVLGEDGPVTTYVEYVLDMPVVIPAGTSFADAIRIFNEQAEREEER